MADKSDIQSVPLVEPSLQGRAGPMHNALSLQGFCSLTSSIVDFSLINDFTEITPGWTTGQGLSRPKTIFDGCARLWLVCLRGIEVYRISGDGQNPLPRDVIMNGPLPAGAIRSENVHAYRARVKVSNESGFAVFDIDMNQQVEFWAQRIEVSILAPTNAVTIASNADLATIVRTEFVVDTLFACQIVPIEMSIGCRDARLTEYFRSPANDLTTFRVPRSAKAVKIYQGEPVSAVATTRWQRLLSTPVIGSINMGGINFAGRESIDASAPIGAESHLQTDLEPLSPRLFVMNWTIRP